MGKKQNIKIPKRAVDSHKGDYGNVLVIAGSIGLTGAGYLCGQAALLTGSGLVTVAIPKSLNTIMETKLTEVMTLPLPETKETSLSLDAEKELVRFSANTDVVAIGPGLSKNKETAKLVRRLVEKIKKPMVIDADAVTALKGAKSVLKKRRNPTVLTPHPGEMARFIDEEISYIQKNRESVAKKVSLEYNCVSVLKGYKTVVANRSDIYVNNTGNSGMSTAGSGDVLTGIIASLIGQGIDAYSSAVLGVYLHGRSGDLAAREKGYFSLIATDILKGLPKVLKEVA